MSVGTSLVMFAGPLLLGFGWRTFWWANAGFVLLALVAVWFAVPPRPVSEAQRSVPTIRLREALATPGIALVCALYLFYPFQYLALIGLMPTYLVEYRGLSVAAAGTIVAALAASNALGNILSAVLMRAGAPAWTLLATGFLSVIVTGPFIYAAGMPLTAMIALSFAFVIISSLIAGVAWAAIPRLATSAPVVGIGFGFLMQTSNIGQLGGPGVMGAWVENFGWASGWIVLIASALIGLILSIGMRAVENRRTRPEL